MSNTPTPYRLSDEQLAEFHREGFLVVDSIFTDDDLRPVIEELASVVDAKARELVAQGQLSRAYEDEPFETRLTKISRETDKIALSIWNGVLSGPAVFNLIRTPRLLDLAEQFCGSELVASSVYRVRPKIPNHVMGPVPWHQDSGYFEPYCDKSLVLTVWVPLVDATEANGCMWVAPRVHRGGVWKHAQRAGKPYLFIPESEFPPGVEPVCAPIKKGGALLLTNLTPHASFENRTETTRWAMDLRYQNAALPTNAKITRLPGESVPSGAGAAEVIPGACYPPEADFLVRSRLRPHEVVKDAAEFNRIRQGHKPGNISRKWETVAAD
jgi:ectoine hydroxylase-related dioxygenase (phytanoyl-CoA dioxygenase family)